MNADFAKGDGFSTNMKNVGLLLRGMIGFDGKPAYRPEPGEDLMFDAVKNVNPHQGTVTMWLCCRDYNPSQPNKRGNIARLQMMFKQGQRHILMQFYECDELYFDWWSSEPPNTLGRVVATRPGIGKGQWHQIALTWVGNELAIYVNGKHYQTRTLPLKAAKTKDLKPEKGKSFIGIRKRFYGDTHKYDVAVDDVKIYGRAFSPIEVRNQYLRLVSGSTAEKIQDFPYGGLQRDRLVTLFFQRVIVLQEIHDSPDGHRRIYLHIGRRPDDLFGMQGVQHLAERNCPAELLIQDLSGSL